MVESRFWKPTSSSATQQFPQFYGTERSITVPITTRYLSTSSARSIRSTPFLTLFLEDPFWYPPIHAQVYQEVSIPRVSSPKPCYTSLTLPPHVLHVPPISFLSNNLFTCLLTPWSTVLLEKLTGSAASQEIPRILWNPEVHYCTHKFPPPVPILSHLHPVPTIKLHYLN